MNAYTDYQSPLGAMILQATDVGLSGLWFNDQATRPTDVGIQTSNHALLTQAMQQLDEYFAGQRRQFDVPIDAQGTAFQQRVWAVLRTIPYGETWSYQQVANALQAPTAMRAVGMANAKNPISIVVPCHRVIAKNGGLAGYAGGIQRKEWLLKHEAVA